MFELNVCRLVRHTDWKLALGILGCICLFNCFFGLLFKPLPKVRNVVKIYILTNNILNRKEIQKEFAWRKRKSFNIS